MEVFCQTHKDQMSWITKCHGSEARHCHWNLKSLMEDLTSDHVTHREHLTQTLWINIESWYSPLARYLVISDTQGHTHVVQASVLLFTESKHTCSETLSPETELGLTALLIKQVLSKVYYMAHSWHIPVHIMRTYIQRLNVMYIKCRMVHNE